MKVLVTGGAGFIGSHLSELLLQKEFQVVGIDNFHLGNQGNLVPLNRSPHYRFQELDVLNQKELNLLFAKEKFDRVYHLAANSDIARGLQERDLDLRLNLKTTTAVLEAMASVKDYAPCKEIVFASTSAIYGDSEHLLHEDFGPLFPVSFYGASKLAAEAFLSAFAHSFGFCAWIVRFPNVVGGRATHGAILDFVKKLEANPEELEVLGNGSQTKPYLYVKELCNAIEFFIGRSKNNLNYVNLGVDSRTTVREIAEIVIAEMGLNAKIKYTGGNVGWVGDVGKFSYDLSKIHKLGWKSSTHSTDAVRLAAREIIAERKK